MDGWRSRLGHWLLKGESRVAPFSAIASSYGEGPLTDESYLSAYLVSPTVHSAVSKIAQDCAAVPLLLKRGERELAEGDEVYRIFRAANPVESDVALWRRFWLSWMLSGEAFLLTDYLGRATPQEFWVLRAQAMTVKTTPSGLPELYKYRTEAGGEVQYEPREIYHAKNPNPLSETRGASPLAAARDAVNLEINTLRHWSAFFKRGARPSVWLYSDRPMDEAVFETMLDGLKKRLGGVDKAHDIMASHSGFKPEPFGTNPKEADFVECYKLIREQILTVLGVPPAVAGVLRSGGLSDANVKEQVELYWKNTILPMLALLERDLQEIVLPRFGPGYTCEFNLDEVPAIQEMHLDRAVRLSTLVASGMLSPNAARKQIGEPPITGGDQVYMPISLQPVGFERPEPEERSLPDGRTKAVENTPARQAKREKAGKRLDTYERLNLTDWKAALKAQVDRLQRRVAIAGAKSAAKAVSWEDVWIDEIEDAQLRMVVLRVLARVLAAQGQAAMDQIDPTGRFLLDDPRVVRWLEEEAAKQVVKINETTRNALRSILSMANEQNLKLNEIQELIQSMPEFGPARALTIARTETTAAANEADTEAWKQSGVVEKKEWLSAGDELVRESHAAVDGEVRGLDEPYSNGLLFPGDPAGDASEVVNCRCTQLPVIEPARSVRLAPSLLDALRSNGNGKTPPKEGRVLASARRVE